MIPNLVLVLKTIKGFLGGIREAQSQNYHYFYLPFDFSKIIFFI